MPSEFGKDRFSDVKPSDALGKLSERSRASRVSLVVIGVVGFFVLAFVAGLIVNSVRGGASNAPTIPKVDIK